MIYYFCNIQAARYLFNTQYTLSETLQKDVIDKQPPILPRNRAGLCSLFQTKTQMKKFPVSHGVSLISLVPFFTQRHRICRNWSDHTEIFGAALSQGRKGGRKPLKETEHLPKERKKHSGISLNGKAELEVQLPPAEPYFSNSWTTPLLMKALVGMSDQNLEPNLSRCGEVLYQHVAPQTLHPDCSSQPEFNSP